MATSAPKDFDEAIETFRDDSLDLYVDARDAAHPETLREYDKPDSESVKFAQSQLERAFSQLVTTATLQAQQTDRAGFAAVVKLMETTATRADEISSKLVSLLSATTPNVALIDALSRALAALAQLSPSDVWTKQGSSGGR